MTRKCNRALLAFVPYPQTFRNVFYFSFILSTVLLYVVVVGLFQSSSVFHVVIVASLLIRRTH